MRLRGRNNTTRTAKATVDFSPWPSCSVPISSTSASLHPYHLLKAEGEASSSSTFTAPSPLQLIPLPPASAISAAASHLGSDAGRQCAHHRTAAGCAVLSVLSHVPSQQTTNLFARCLRGVCKLLDLTLRCLRQRVCRYSGQCNQGAYVAYTGQWY